MIEIRNIAKRFKAPGAKSPGLGALLKKPAATWVEAVKDVSVTAANGRITGLLGPNGAGKTTSLRMLAGLFRPDTGSIRVDEVDVIADPQAALGRMGILGDAHGLYPRLTARENVIYFGRLQGMTAEAASQRAEQLAELLEMKHILDRRAEGFSQGERMKTALARALVHDPANIVLDEPTNGLDVLATRSLREALRVLAREQGKCIVFSTHIMQEVEYLCDEVVVVSHGRSVARGSVDELKQQSGCADFEDAFVALAFPDIKEAA